MKTEFPKPKFTYAPPSCAAVRVRQFVAERCEEGEVCASAGALYAAYSAWAEESHRGFGLSQKMFGIALELLGYSRTRNSAARGWWGLRLK